jgi:hypothetical protein
MSGRNPFVGELQPCQHPHRAGRWRFVSESNGQVIASAFVLPLLRRNGATWALLQEEDEPEDGSRHLPLGQRPCTPRLGMLGGKVGATDSHWVNTATREVGEETGIRPDGSTLLSAAALSDIREGFRTRCADKPAGEAAAFEGYLSTENASAMLCFYPVPEQHRTEWASLPERFASEFNGEVDHEKERHGTRLIWVRVRTSSQPHEPCLDMSSLLHECAGGDPVRCAVRCGRGEASTCQHAGRPLQMKRVLELGLPLLLGRREMLAQYLIANRLHHLLSRSAASPPTHGAKPSVGQLTLKFVSAWSKGGRLHELEKAMEQEAWLAKEVEKVTGGGHGKGEKKRPREEHASSSGAPGASGASGGPKATYAARHLLIKWSGSRNPVSKRTNESTSGVSAEAATAELAAIRERILAEGGTEEAFSAHAQARSDCSSFKRGGDLGTFAAGKMQRAFEEGTRDCALGSMSGVLQSDSGFHLIWRYG